MSWFQGGRNVGIRTRLFLLFAVPVLVIVSSRTWELTQEYRARLTAAYDRTLTLTRTGIERQEGVISEIRGLLQVLGRVPDITTGSGSNCRRLLSEITQDKPWLKGLWIVEPNGQSVCSTVVGGVGLDFSDKHYFRRAVETRTFAIEHYWVGRLRGMPAAVAALPIVDGTGAVTKVIMASFDLAWLVSIQDEVTRSAGATFLLIDESGTVLARYPETESLVERNFANHPLVQAMRGISQGQFEKPDLDGEQRIFGFAQLPGTNSRLVIGFSRSKVLEAINWQTIMSVISLVIVCALGLVVAWVGGEKLIATRLREQNLRLEAAKLQLDAAMNNMPHGLCMFDADQRMVVCNTKYAEMYGLKPEHTSPGTTLREILKLRVEKGNSPESAEEYIEERIREVSGGTAYTKQNELRDGRILSIMHQPMANGGWVAIHQDITEQRTIEKKIAHMAHHDALTGLPNRILLREQLEHVLSYGPRGQTLAVLCLDLDHFKNVNDTLGHPVGDSLLRHVADRLRGCLRDTDIVARLGGDEFAIVQVGTEQPVGATILAQRVIDVMSATFEVDGHQLVIGTSVGIAIAPNDGTEPDQLLRNADMALYRAKADGRNASRFFETAMDAKMQERRSLELDLRKALVNSEFELVYQPQVNSRTYEVVGFEALLRWNHPTRGRVSPDQFIELAEETGIINQLGEWVLRRACSQASSWPDHIRVAVNLSPVQFRNKNLVSIVVSAVAAARLSPNRLELEITEAVLLENSADTITALHQLRAFGVRIAMDDFGTGYSSLSYLRSFPFDKIKIDRSFVRDLTERKDSIAIIRAVAALGKDLGMETTAEGVETEEQLALVRAEGCTEIQGYLFSAPCAANEVKRLLRRLEKRKAVA